MRVPHPRYVGPIRNRVIRVQAIADYAARLDELEGGIPEHLRQAADLQRFLDGLEQDVVSLVESRLDDPGDPGGDG